MLEKKNKFNKTCSKLVKFVRKMVKKNQGDNKASIKTLVGKIIN